MDLFIWDPKILKILHFEETGTLSAASFTGYFSIFYMDYNHVKIMIFFQNRGHFSSDLEISLKFHLAVNKFPPVICQKDITQKGILGDASFVCLFLLLSLMLVNSLQFYLLLMLYFPQLCVCVLLLLLLLFLFPTCLFLTGVSDVYLTSGV